MDDGEVSRQDSGAVDIFPNPQLHSVVAGVVCRNGDDDELVTGLDGDWGLVSAAGFEEANDVRAGSDEAALEECRSAYSFEGENIPARECNGP